MLEFAAKNHVKISRKMTETNHSRRARGTRGRTTPETQQPRTMESQMTTSVNTIHVHLTQQHDYQFSVEFGGAVPPLLADEPPPLGNGAGPSPVQLLAGAVGNCLADSLLFAFRKFKQQPEPITCDVQANVGRNDSGRLRVLSMQATLTLGVAGQQLEHVERVLAQFEAFCTVTQSVGAAFPIEIQVVDVEGKRWK